MTPLFQILLVTLLGWLAMMRWNMAIESLQGKRPLAALFHMCLSLLSLLVIYFMVTAAAEAGEPPPRRLIVWTDPTCENCREFWDDVNAGLEQELAAAGWRIDRYEIRRRPLQAWALGIMEVPCFVKFDEGRYWYGYHPAGFREAFALSPLASPPALSAAAGGSSGSPAALSQTSPQPVSQADLEQWLANQFQEQRAQLEQQLSQQTSADQAATQSLEQALQLQQTVINELRGGDPEVDSRLDQIAHQLQQLARPGPEIVPAPESPPASTPAVHSQSTSQAGWFMKLGRFALTAAETAGLFGLTGFSGFGAIVAAKGVVGWMRRRYGRKKPTATDAGESSSLPESHREYQQRIMQLEREIRILKAQPPAKEQPSSTSSTSKTHYQQVPVVDVEAEALKESMRRVAQVYPDAARFMELVEQSAGELARGMRLTKKQQNQMQAVTGGLPWDDPQDR